MSETGTGPAFAELGDNLVELAAASAAIPFSLALGMAGLVGRLLHGTPRHHGEHVHIQRTCDGIVRHHYRCCCVPPCYGCGGCCT